MTDMGSRDPGGGQFARESLEPGCSGAALSARGTLDFRWSLPRLLLAFDVSVHTASAAFPRNPLSRHAMSAMHGICPPRFRQRAHTSGFTARESKVKGTARSHIFSAARYRPSLPSEPRTLANACVLSNRDAEQHSGLHALSSLQIGLPKDVGLIKSGCERLLVFRWPLPTCAEDSCLCSAFGVLAEVCRAAT